MSVKRRYYLRKASAKRLGAELVEKFGGAALGLLKGALELVEIEDGREVLLAGGKPLLLRTPDGLFPTLYSIDEIQLKRVIVDMGAVPHIASGADIMAPGIVSADEDILPGDGVVIVDEKHGKPLAIGLALVAGASMKAPKGRAIKNLHHVGDEVWGTSRLPAAKVK